MRNQDLDAACAAVRAMGDWGEVVGWELARKWLIEHGFDAAGHELPAAGTPRGWRITWPTPRSTASADWAVSSHVTCAPTFRQPTKVCFRSVSRL